MKELKPDEVIAGKEAANMRGIEKLLHKRYKHQRIPQTEYFRLTSEEVDELKAVVRERSTTFRRYLQDMLRGPDD